MKHVSLTPAVFHLPARVNAIADAYARNPIVPRGPRLRPILGRLREKIGRTLRCEGTHVPIFVTASGSGAIAAALGSCVGDDGILVVSNGAYGERQARYAEQIGLRCHHLAFAYGERPDLERIEALATQHDLGTIGIVHGATSSCSLNPIEEVASLCKRLGKRLLVDGIASLFVERVDLADIDVMVGAANKGLHANPDLAFVLVSERLVDEIADRPGRIPYLDLGEAWRAQREGAHPYTINARALLEVEAALDALEEEGGVDGRIATYRARNSRLRAGFESLGLERFERPGMPLQNIGTALLLPEGIGYPSLADALASWDEGDECYEIYAAQGKLADHVFRIFNMGDYPLETYDRFLAALGATLSRLRGR